MSNPDGRVARAGLTALVPAAAVTVAGGVAVSLLIVTGAMPQASAVGLPDPGALTRWGLPASRAVRDTAMLLTLGALTVAVLILPGKKAGLLAASQLRLAWLAVATGTMWLVSGCIQLVLSFADIAGIEPSSTTMQQLRFFISEMDAGEYLGWNVALAAVVTFIALSARTTTGLAGAVVLTVAALWTVALTGHAASDANHDLAVNLQFLHVLGIGLWFGGLVALLWVRRDPGLDLSVAARRYSRIAGWCFVAIAVSGTAAALLRVSQLADLASSYGAILVVKVVVFGLLGLAGWWQRSRLLTRLQDTGDRRAFTVIAVAEILLLAFAAGAGAALGRTPPPGAAASAVPTPTEELLGHAMPPPLGLAQWFNVWRIDSFWAPIAVAAAVIYLLGVRRLRRRGDRWSTGRTIAWLFGCFTLLWATSGPPGAYGDVLFSMHMVQHMTVATAVPSFLVLGAPVTLGLRALVRRDDGSRGAREWLLLAVHSWPARLLGNPIVAATMFVVGMIAFYYSSAFESSLRGHTMHLLMTAHFLFAGYLFANVICGVDPGPKRPIYPLRVLLVMVVFGFHALFSISLMSATQLLAGDWFTSLERTWGRSPQDDQYLGASLGWGLGEYPLAILAVAVVWSWVRDDHREAKRLDRQADRDNDQALSQYNAYLSSAGRSRSADTEPS